MNDWGLGQLVFHSRRAERAFVPREEERVSLEMFGVLIIVDGDVHKVAPVKMEGSTLFGSSENIGPHNFSWAI
jgi:hypothetical protein